MQPGGVRRSGQWARKRADPWLDDGKDRLRSERTLATARVFLALAGFVALSLDPTEPAKYAPVVDRLLHVYGVLSISIVGLLRVAAPPPGRLPLLSVIVHISLGRTTDAEVQRGPSNTGLINENAEL